MKKLSISILAALMMIMMIFSTSVFAVGEENEAAGTEVPNGGLATNATEQVGVTYRTHVENEGWEKDWALNGNTAGTQGKGLRLEGIQIKLSGSYPAGAAIEYRTHVENLGWEYAWTSNGNTSGSQGKGLRLEGIQIRLVNMPDYTIEYRTHVQNDGWETIWAKDGATSGTQGRGLRLEGIEIRIVKKNVDLTAYKAILAEINAEDEDDYTAYSWERLQTVIADNKVTTTNAQTEIDAATKAIQAAFDALEKEADAKVYSKAGTYGPAKGTETISKDVIIDADNVTLQNLRIKGNLIISEKVGDGEVTLNNITVDGETFVRGGGENSIHINGGEYNRITIQQAPDGKIRLVALDADGIEIVIAEDLEGETVILEGEFDSVQVDAPDVNIETQGTTVIAEMTISENGEGSQITMSSASQVSSMVFDGAADVKGQGKIIRAQVNADNVTYEREPVKVTVDPSVEVEPELITVLVKTISVNSPNNATTVLKGSTMQMSTTFTPANASNTKVTWTIINGTGSATISSSGLLTPITIGTVTVKATAQDGSGKFGMKTLTVNNPATAAIASATVLVNGTVNPSIVVTLTNDTFTATANQLANWTSTVGTTGLTLYSIVKNSDTQVTIYTTGTTVAGTMTLQAKAAALTKGVISNTLSLTSAVVPVTAITVTSAGNATSVAMGSTLQMGATITPSNASNKNVTWSVTAGTGSASISSTGLLTPVTVGTVTVRATAQDGTAIYGTKTITVTSALTGTIATATTIAKGAVNPSIVVTLTNDTFTATGTSTLLTNWTTGVGTTGLTIASITRNSDTTVTINTTGTAAAGTITLQAKAAALTKAVASNTLSVVVPQSNDATLKVSSTVKGQTVTSLGTSNATLASAVSGSVTITAAKAADTSNAGSFITLFDKTDAGATVKVVKYASGASTANFATDAAYTNTAITNNDFFIVRVTAANGTTIAYYKVVVTVTPATAPVIATVSTIANGAVNPTVTVTGTNFKAGIAASDLTVGVGTTNLTAGTVTYVSATQITVAFTGTAAAGNVTIQAKTSAFDPVGSAASNSLTVTVPAAAPVIATVSTIANGAVNPTVTVTGTNFKAGIAASDLTVGVGTTNLTAGTVTYVSATQITVAFTGTAAAGNVTIQAKTSAFDPVGSAASNSLTVTVPAAAPVIATVSTIANGAVNPTVTVTGTNFKAGIAASDLTVDVGTTNLTAGTVTYVSATQITVAFTGTAAAGNVTIQAKTSAFDPVGSAASNSLTVTVPAAAPVIATVSTIANGAVDPTVTVTGTNFKAGIAASDLTVDVGTTNLTAGTVTYVSATQITVAFTGTAAAGNVTIQAKTSAFDPVGSAASNSLTVTVPAAAPVIATVSTIANGAVNPTVTVTGTNFKAGIAASDLTVGVGTTNLTAGTVTYVSATQITVAFTGTAAAGNVTIQAKTSAFDPVGSAASNSLTVTVPAAAPAIETGSTIANSAVDPTVTVTGTNFKAGIAASDLTVGVGTTNLTAGTVTYVSATQITVAFTGTAAAGNVTIQAKTSAFDPVGSADSNTLTVTVQE